MIVRRIPPVVTAFLLCVLFINGFAHCGAGDSTSCVAGGKLADAEAQIARYLEESSKAEGKFLVQGWRWHTMSLAREAGRLQELAARLQGKNDSELSALQDAAEYVVGFNMKGLHSIEKDLFFPWVREKVKSEKMVEKYFYAVMDQLENDRRRVEKLGASLVSLSDVGERSRVKFAVDSQFLWYRLHTERKRCARC